MQQGTPTYNQQENNASRPRHWVLKWPDTQVSRLHSFDQPVYRADDSQTVSSTTPAAVVEREHESGLGF